MTAVSYRSWFEDRRTTLIAIAVIGLVLVGGFATVASQSGGNATPKATLDAHSHAPVNAPSVDDPLAPVAPALIPAGGSSQKQVPVPGLAAPVPQDQIPVGGKPQPANGSYFEKEAQPGDLVAVKDAPPTSFPLPGGATLIGNAVRYPNGVYEWRYAASKMDLESGIAYTKRTLAAGGWKISSDTRDPDLTEGDGTIQRTHRIYASTAGWKGVFVLTSRSGRPGMQFQLDLQRI